MNLTKKLSHHIISEFKRGVSMAECDRVFLLKPGTTEKLVRNSLKEESNHGKESNIHSDSAE